MKHLRLTALLAVAISATALLNAVAAGPRFNPNAPLLPDPKLSPGDALPVTSADICVPGYSKKVRDVPQSVKEQVFQEYGITHRAKGEYEVDHIISLELGGSNSIRNLFPESYKTKPWNAHVKDKLENAFHDDVCKGRLALPDAQAQISGNWIAAYKKRFPTDPLATLPAPGQAVNKLKSLFSGRKRPASAPTKVPAGTPNVTAGQVWVNTKSGVYWRPGTRYYGKTKAGSYMSESDANKAGYHAAGGQ